MRVRSLVSGIDSLTTCSTRLLADATAAPVADPAERRHGERHATKPDEYHSTR